MSTLAATNLKHASSASNNIVLDSSGNVTFAGTAVPSSSFLRNRIINGAMQIWQRGTSFTNVGSGGPPTYTTDRWFGFRGGFASNLSVSQQTGFSGFQYCTRIQRANGDTSTQPLQLCQIVENLNMYDLASLPVVFSFYARTAPSGYSGGGLLVNVTTGTASDQSSNTFANGAWTGQATSVSGTITLTSTATRYTVTGTLGAGINELAVQFLWTPTGTAGASDYIEITGCQLEVGTAATPFERRQYGQELMLCQRYYEANVNTNAGLGTATGFSGSVTSGSNYYVSTSYLVQKRAAPTITLYNANLASFPSAAVAAATGTTSFLMSGTANGTNTGGFYFYDFAASAEL